MKNLFAISFALILALPALADMGTLENVEVKTSHVGVKFEDNEETLTLSFNDNISGPMHSIIEIQKISDLKYKTSVMRYFGGLLVSETFNFKNLVLEIDGQRTIYDFNRANISAIVNKMCQHAELILPI